MCQDESTRHAQRVLFLSKRFHKKEQKWSPRIAPGATQRPKTGAKCESYRVSGSTICRIVPGNEPKHARKRVENVTTAAHNPGGAVRERFDVADQRCEVGFCCNRVARIRQRPAKAITFSLKLSFLLQFTLENSDVSHRK